MAIFKNDFLNLFPYFKGSKETLIEDILSCAKHATAPGNQVLKKEGDKLTDFVLLLSGSKRVFKVSDSGREITLYEMGAGDICVLNVSCILSNSKLPANAESLSDVEMLLISDHDFMRLMTEHAEMQSFVFSRFSQSLTNIMSLISEISFAKMDQRLAEYLIEKSENNILKTAHRYIANDLGTSREVVSRLLKDLERQGLVKLSRNHIELEEVFFDHTLVKNNKP